MNADDQKYFDAAFKLIQARLTNLETQVTLLFNAEKKRIAEAAGVSLEENEKILKPITEKVFRDLDQMAAALKAHIESESSL
ncbi:MAG TPA: hypothetical protein DC054_19375 [Blastocatellia bacterium]|nr:hypothetical protein [Blastocatellia bacterium]